ncbi:MAG: cytochrome-c oxidase, cbb3-type subunit III [Pseudomonadota bacterium]
MPTKVEKDALTGTDTTGHEWDGIKELNNPLPRWWLYVFYATIVYAVIWMVLYPSIPSINSYFGGILGFQQREILDNQVADARQAQADYLDAIADSHLTALAEDPELFQFSLAGGQAAYNNNCAPCHGLGGAGQANYPVLADDVWLWGGALDDIRHTLEVGIRWEDNPDTRYSLMPAYGTLGVLTRDQIRDVANYVLTLSGNEAADPEAAGRGAETYAAQCVACHMADGSGDREQGTPALNDQLWLYGGDFSEIMAQITAPRHGVMPAWGDRLDPATLNMLTLYVHSLGGGE